MLALFQLRNVEDIFDNLTRKNPNQDSLKRQIHSYEALFIFVLFLKISGHCYEFNLIHSSAHFMFNSSSQTPI
ncbi:hypothetical protein NIES30_25700 [Phormidium tenue NIES-30]|uniref:Uncharacterized protein n=1 Tax=Phormidium tenue NIES-30 TaxID=549789 RepID=A0A1U7IXT7_9CYAN|nr:hypothetical protein NIES30_25700 [Phormidium tenue NIES-30]